MNGDSLAFWTGVEDGLEKAAAAPKWGKNMTAKERFVHSRSPGKKIKDIKAPKKPEAPSPSKKFGLGTPGLGTMEASSMKLRAQKLQQPKKPPRY